MAQSKIVQPDLPPLPKLSLLCRFMPDDYRYGDVLGFTTDQMHAYAAAAVLAEREKMLADIRAEIALEGFGCACTPNKSCGTCIARRTLLCALDPLLRRYEAAIRAEPIPVAKGWRHA